jgi:hypothetical protein
MSKKKKFVPTPTQVTESIANAVQALVDWYARQMESKEAESKLLSATDHLIFINKALKEAGASK